MGRIRLPVSIMVNNDLERDSLLEYFESKDIYWSSNKRPTEFHPSDRYPYNINYGNYGYLTYDGRKRRTSVSYSEFIKRRDTNYTFYRHKYENYLIVSSYKGIGFRLGDIYLFTNIWNIYDIRDFIPINENLVIKRTSNSNNKNVIKRNIKNNNIIFGNILTGKSVIFDDISFHTGGSKVLLSELNDNWVDVDKVMIKQ